nr:hypothetical protein BaRGS_027184 [Batillaria attramentaria]
MSGRPRCDVNTILHILHDLLVAQPSGHMTRPAQHRHGNQTPPPRRFFPEENVSEDTALRDKVQRIQMMLEERRQRRLARRNNQRPYPPRQHLAKCASSLHPHSSSPDSICSCQRPPTPLTPNPDNTAASTTPTTAANHAENMETTNYRKPNMEQETVAV